MSQHRDDLIDRKIPGTAPHEDRSFNDDDEPNPGGGPPKGGLAEYTQLHGDIRKGQDPKEEKD
jgi:hypothetical protein